MSKKSKKKSQKYPAGDEFEKDNRTASGNIPVQ